MTRALAWLAVAVMTALVGSAAALHAQAPGTASPGRQIEVDLELVLAVDISYSMDPEEQRLQRDGYVLAFRDKALWAAIASGKNQRIAITYFEWAGPPVQGIVLPWTLIDGPAAAEAVAAKLEAHPISRGRMTSISSALSFGEALFGTGGFKGLRRTIDVSQQRRPARDHGPGQARQERHCHQRSAGHAEARAVGLLRHHGSR